MDDTDLRLTWEGEWKQQSGPDDTIAKVSFGGSYHATETSGSMLTIRMFRSAVTFYTISETLRRGFQGHDGLFIWL
jgi:hypothetical protein